MDIAIASWKRAIQDKKRTQECIEDISVKNEKSLYEKLIAPIECHMMRSIWRIVRDPQEAEDTLQEALAIIWRRLDRIRRHPNPHALIFKICLNSAYDSLRKRKRIRQVKGTELLHQLPIQSEMTAPEVSEKKKIEAEILNAISRLPRRQAVAVLMRIVQEQPYDVIAQALDCSEVTVRIHVSRGRARLRQWLSHLNPASLNGVSK